MAFIEKIVEQWLLFKYVDREFTPLSKPFKTKKQAEEIPGARTKNDRVRRRSDAEVDYSLC